MSGILIHDGRRPGHHGWCTSAISARAADGVIISPFSTPRFTVPRFASGEDFAQTVRAGRGEVIFDASTHARLLPGTNKLDHYETWELWGASGIGLDAPQRCMEHIERVFNRQQELGTHSLAPTMTLDMPQTPASDQVVTAAQIARGLDRGCWQSLAGTRSFWAAGSRLDAFVGRLAALQAPAWVVTVINEVVLDSQPDLSNTVAFSGLYRTIHSLSERSRVVLAHSDFAGLLGVAAGADTVGSGWDKAMRTFDPTSYHVSSEDSVRIPASYVTQGALASVLRRDTAEAIERWNREMAAVIRDGPMPPSAQAERVHHLSALRDALAAISDQPDRRGRVQRLRQLYDNAGQYFDTLITALPGVVVPTDKRVWRDNQLAGLRSYAAAERLW